MIPDFKTYLKESVWGDLRKKSLGQEDRIESGVDNLGPEEFYEYLNCRYRMVDDYEIKYSDKIETIAVPIFYGYSGCDMYTYEKNYLATLTMKREDMRDWLIEKLREKYNVSFEELEKDWWDVHLTPKDGDASPLPNSFIVEVIDYIIDLSPEMDKETGNLKHLKVLIEKNINESVWGDLRKKSLGQELRDENIVKFDDLNEGTMEDLYNYIIQNYEYTKEPANEYRSIRQLSGKDISVPITLDGGMMETTTDFLNHDEMEFIVIRNDLVKYLDDEAYSRYFDYVEKDNPDDENTKIIVDGDYFPKKNVIGIIDALIENVPNPALKKKAVRESVWGDLRKKSLGQEKRGEDKITLANLDYAGIDGLVKYIETNYEQCGKFNVENHKNEGYVLIPIIDASELYFSNVIQVMTYMRSPDKIAQVDIPSWFRFRLTDNYYVNKKRSSDNQYAVTSKEHTNYVSNTEVIDIIDTLLYDLKNPALRKKEPIKESVWGELRKKSLGQEVREEDNVENLDGDEFREYIEKRYEYIDTNNDPKIYGFKSKQHYVEVPLLKYGYAPYKIFIQQNADSGRWLSISPYKGKYVMFPYVVHRRNGQVVMEPEIYKMLREEYDTEEVYDMQGSDRIVRYLSIRPKNGSEITNRFFLDVIDFALDNMTDPFEPTIKKL